MIYQILVLLFISFSAYSQSFSHSPTFQSLSGLLGVGEYCESATECQSGFCSSEACSIPFYKVCDIPGRTCLPRNANCFFNADCCSNLCSSSGICVADGKNECVPNDSSFRFSAKECCSKKGTSDGLCRGSKNSCAFIGASCLQHSDCCSKRCGSNQHCAP